MTDAEIIALYWQRSERAIDESDRAYGSYCNTVAYNVLGTREDALESVNDTWFAAWNAMPPHRPDSLKAFLGKLCRRIAISRLRKNNSQKRGGGEAMLALEELTECLKSRSDPAEAVEAKELAAGVDRFLATLSRQDRVIFTARYWYLLPVEQIAGRLGLKGGTVKSSLYRSRGKLRRYLEKEGL